MMGAKWGKLTEFAELDFSSFEQPGRSCLSLGDKKSLPFTISAEVFRPLPPVVEAERDQM